MLRASRSWVDGQVREIADDRVLRLYGVVLAYANVLTFVYWHVRRDVTRVIGDNQIPICWPFWENCHAWRVLTPEGVAVVLWTYLALSLATGACFLLRRGVAWGWVGLLVVTAIRFGIMAQDFTLRLNQHYMANWVTIAFLLFPRRRALVPALLVSFYFWAGALKLDAEWLTGAALYARDRFWVPEALVPASCVYVVALELVLVFGVYARRGWIFWGTLAQLAVFHVFSWPIVGFFYPMLMFGLLAMFPMLRLAPGSSRSPTTGEEPGVPAGDGPDRDDGGDRALSVQELARPGVRLPAALLLGGFALTQLLPLAMPGDSAITGEGRLFALNMFDAQVVCEGYAVLHQEGGGTKRIRLSNVRYPRRIACDPILFFNLAGRECRRTDRRPRTVDLDLELRSRRSSEPELREVIDVRNFCSSGVTYDLWRPNDWILKQAASLAPTSLDAPNAAPGT